MLYTTCLYTIIGWYICLSLFKIVSLLFIPGLIYNSTVSYKYNTITSITVYLFITVSYYLLNVKAQTKLISGF